MIFLNSDAASYISGENVNTDGGTISGLTTGTITLPYDPEALLNQALDNVSGLPFSVPTASPQHDDGEPGPVRVTGPDHVHGPAAQRVGGRGHGFERGERLARRHPHLRPRVVRVGAHLERGAVGRVEPEHAARARARRGRRRCGARSA